MDRPLDEAVRRRRTIRRAAVGIGIVGGAVAAFVIVLGWIRPSIDLARHRVGVVDRGPIEATITAIGHVVPRHEQVLTSPIDSRVERIHLTPGAAVAPGEPIVSLAVEEADRELEKLDEQIALQENARRRARLSLESTIGDLESRRRIKELELRSHELDVEKNRRLHEAGLITEDALRGAETDAARARIELEQLATRMDTERRSLEAELEKLNLEVEILRKDRADAADRRRRAVASSDRDGILTWVVADEGAAVVRGAELARVADLSSFRVEATVSDVHAEQVEAGLPATIRVGDRLLRGRVSSVRPAVENGAVAFEVDLAEASHSALRHNLRVDVHLVTDRREDALRLPRGEVVHVPGEGRCVFVLRGDTAVRTPVELGLTSFEAREVVSGLREGDRVLLSDMSNHAHVREVRIR
jgi:HlyD family secretion protein